MKCLRVMISFWFLQLALAPCVTISQSEQRIEISPQSSIVRKTERGKQEKITRKENFAWIGDISEAEKKDLLDFLQKHKEFHLPPSSDVVKSDLDGDGKPEYIMHLGFRWPASYFSGTVLALILESKDGFQVMVVSGPGQEFGILELNLKVVDFDGDGLEDIIQTKILEEDPEDPRGDYYSSTIYKNYKINEQMRFKEVYKRVTYDYVKFKDLDKNGTKELIESVNELPYETYMGDPKWRWINIYTWDGRRFRKANAKYLSFYLEKEKEYRALLKEAVEKDREFKKKGHRTIYETAVKAMKEYLKRIEEMKGRRE